MSTISSWDGIVPLDSYYTSGHWTSGSIDFSFISDANYWQGSPVKSNTNFQCAGLISNPAARVAPGHSMLTYIIQRPALSQ